MVTQLNSPEIMLPVMLGFSMVTTYKVRIVIMQLANYSLTPRSAESQSKVVTPSHEDPAQDKVQRPIKRKKTCDDPEVTILNQRLKYYKHDRQWYSQYRVVRVADDDPDEKIRGRTLVVIDNRETKEHDAVLCLAFHRHFAIEGEEDDEFFETNTRAYTDRIGRGNKSGSPPPWVPGDNDEQQAPIMVVAAGNYKFLENTWLDGRRRKYLPYSSKVAAIGTVCRWDDSYYSVGQVDNVAEAYKLRIED